MMAAARLLKPLGARGPFSLTLGPQPLYTIGRPAGRRAEGRRAGRRAARTDGRIGAGPSRAELGVIRHLVYQGVALNERTRTT
jgi:hypothetical protein